MASCKILSKSLKKRIAGYGNIDMLTSIPSKPNAQEASVICAVLFKERSIRLLCLPS